MAGTNQNKRVVDANKANVARVLSAIRHLRKRAADAERTYERLEAQVPPVDKRHRDELADLGKRVKRYFINQRIDPGGCVSDPNDTCLTHLDDISDEALRDEFKKELDRIDRKYDNIVRSIRSQQSAARDDKKAAFGDYELTLAKIGEWFAQTVAAITGRKSVSEVPVLFNASEVLPDRVYISTLDSGGSNYISYAIRFHEQWKLPIVEIQSLEELLDDSIGRRSKAARIRIVAHGSLGDIRLRMFKNGSLELDDERIETFLEGTLPLFRYLIGYPQLDERQPAQRVAAAVRRAPVSAALVSTFGLKKPSRIVAAFLLYDALLHSRAYEASAGDAAALVEAALRAITTLLRKRLQTGEVTAAALRQLDQAIKRAIANDARRLRLNAISFNALQKDDLKALVGFLASYDSLEVRIAQFQKLLGKKTYVDIRGCQVALSNRMLRAAAGLFKTARSNVTAPNTLLGFARAERYVGVSLECDQGSIAPLPAMVEQANNDQGKLAHEPAWTGADYLNNYVRFLGIAKSTRGWLFRSDSVRWDDLPSQIKAAEVMYFIPFFVWLAETPVPINASSTATTITDVRVYLDYLFDCTRRDIKPALRHLLRTFWADAPHALVSSLAQEIADGTTPPYLPMLDTGVLASTTNGSRLKLGQYVLSYDPDFSASILTAK